MTVPKSGSSFGLALAFEFCFSVDTTSPLDAHQVG